MSSYMVISKSPQMKYVFSLVEAVSKTTSTVLITGETGTGKELIAQAIHQNSKRSGNHFVAINCGAIPSELMESELFGHEKGAFTGAHTKRIGKLEYANGGTVFLDEISTLPMYLQVKLLRVIQERSFEPVGSLIPVEIDVRFIAAANVDLFVEIKKGSFREDLYYRLNVVPIKLPPLRERKEDIPILVNHYIEKYLKKYDRRITGITDKAMDILIKYPWPGNIRELQNLSEMMVVLAKEDRKIDVNILPSKFLDYKEPDIDDVKESHTFNEAVISFEKKYITEILKKNNWNKTEAAKKMGIHRNTLLNKLRELQIEAPS